MSEDERATELGYCYLQLDAHEKRLSEILQEIRGIALRLSQAVRLLEQLPNTTSIEGQYNLLLEDAPKGHALLVEMQRLKEEIARLKDLIVSIKQRD